MTDEKKFFNLINGKDLPAAPNKKELYGEWSELTIGIGNDHTATILIDKDSIVELYARNEKRKKGDKIIWVVKQLLPFKYNATYTMNNEKHYTVWRMWFGRCFQIEDVIL